MPGIQNYIHESFKSHAAKAGLSQNLMTGISKHIHESLTTSSTIFSRGSEDLAEEGREDDSSPVQLDPRACDVCSAVLHSTHHRKRFQKSRHVANGAPRHVSKYSSLMERLEFVALAHPGAGCHLCKSFLEGLRSRERIEGGFDEEGEVAIYQDTHGRQEDGPCIKLDYRKPRSRGPSVTIALMLVQVSDRKSRVS